MSIATQIQRLQTIKTNIRNALVAKGIAASSHDFADFATDISNIPGGGTTPTVTNIECSLEAPSGNLWGDANKDGTLTSADLTLIENYTVSPSVYVNQIDLEAADLNGDGAVDNRDLIYAASLFEDLSAGEILAKITQTLSDGTSRSYYAGTTPPKTRIAGTTYTCGRLAVPSDMSDLSLDLPHGLGRTPTSVTMWASPRSLVAGGIVSMVYMGAQNTSGVSYFNSAATGAETAVGPSYFSADATNISIYTPSGTKLPAGWTYYWVAI